ncbi:MAG: alpha-glucosidase C-terminal domain-containing protein, partial [Crocinitomicaceae bacterium]
HHIMNEVAKGHRNADSIVEYFEREAARFPSSAFRLHFTSNHDENSWNGTEYERMGDGVETFAVLSATVHGMPLIYNGQETSLKKRLEFFEKDAIQWTEMDKAPFYTKLFAFKETNPALWNGDYGAYPEFLAGNNPDVLVFARRKGSNTVLVVLNLSGEEQKVKTDLKNCIGEYTELFTGESKEISKKKGKFKLKPWEYRVYSFN